MLKSKNSYELPLPADAVTEIVKASESHSGAYEGSIDFATPLNTPILAAADGNVIRVRDDSDKYGQEPSFGPDVNYITIEHANNELSEYLHLAKDSAFVKSGDIVKSGQQIAVTGLSGWLYAPHLHFMIYDKAPKKFQCKSIRFKQPLQLKF